MKRIWIFMAIVLLMTNIFWPLTYAFVSKDSVDVEHLAHTFYIDPEVKERDNVVEFLILFKDETSMRKAFKKIVSSFNVLSEFKIIPMILVRGNLNKILADRDLMKKVSGIFANKKYELKWRKEKIWGGVTTNYTAYKIGANIFWENGYSGDGIRVCVIDSGINATHIELLGKVVASKSFVSPIYGYDYYESSPKDRIGHGTAVAGIIAGNGIDPRGQGMAPGVVLMNAKVVAVDGTITLAGLIAAIEWASYGPDGIPGTGDEADIINMSLGSFEMHHSPTWLAIRKAAEQGILIVCAAGNEGNMGTNSELMLNSMSINDPANAKYSIAVGAISPYLDALEEYSSFGPTINMVVKPEIAAPSNVIVLNYKGGYTSVQWRGTSFSTPHVTGALALILDYLKSKGLSKSHRRDMSWATLMYTASPIYTRDNKNVIKLEDLAIGVGVVNLTEAYGVLSSYNISDNSYPQMVTILPKRLPVGLSNSSSLEQSEFFPYFDRLFVGQTLVFNFSVFASKETFFEVSMSGNISDILVINSEITYHFVPPVSYFEINISVRLDASEGYYEGLILFNDSLHGNVVKVPMRFLLVNPRAKVLFDLKHTGWVIDHRYGQYRFFVRYLEVENNISIEQLYHNQKMSYEILSKFDVLFCPDVASAEAIFYENGTYSMSKVNNFEPKEIDAIWRFIDGGGMLIIFALLGEYQGTVIHNITNINELLKPTGIEFRDDVFISDRDNPVSVDVCGRHVLSRGIYELPYYGIGLKVNVGLSEVLLKYEDVYLAAIYQGSRGGGVIALGTNFIFDNWAYYGLYSGAGTNGTNVKTFYDNLADFITLEKSIIKNITVLGNITRGSNITLKMYNTTNIENATWTYTYVFGNRSGTLYYSTLGRYWYVEIYLRVAGYAYIKAKAILSDGYHVCRSMSFEVEKTEENSPIIKLLDMSNGTTIDIPALGPEGLIIRIEIKDDEALLLESLNITTNVYNYTMHIEGSEKSILIEIRISRSIIDQHVMMGAGFFSILIRVSCSDVNLNIATNLFVIHLRHTTYGKMWLFFIMIVLVIMVIIALLILREG